MWNSNPHLMLLLWPNLWSLWITSNLLWGDASEVKILLDLQAQYFVMSLKITTSGSKRIWMKKILLRGDL